LFIHTQIHTYHMPASWNDKLEQMYRVQERMQATAPPRKIKLGEQAWSDFPTRNTPRTSQRLSNEVRLRLGTPRSKPTAVRSERRVKVEAAERLAAQIRAAQRAAMEKSDAERAAVEMADAAERAIAIRIAAEKAAEAAAAAAEKATAKMVALERESALKKAAAAAKRADAEHAAAERAMADRGAAEETERAAAERALLAAELAASEQAVAEQAADRLTSSETGAADAGEAAAKTRAAANTEAVTKGSKQPRASAPRLGLFGRLFGVPNKETEGQPAAVGVAGLAASSAVSSAEAAADDSAVQPDPLVDEPVANEPDVADPRGNRGGGGAGRSSGNGDGGDSGGGGGSGSGQDDAGGIDVSAAATHSSEGRGSGAASMQGRSARTTMSSSHALMKDMKDIARIRSTGAGSPSSHALLAARSAALESAAPTNPRRALREAEHRSARRAFLDIEERNAGLDDYCARRTAPAPGWQSPFANTAGFGSRDTRFAAYWRAPAHKPQTSVVVGPGVYELDPPGSSASLGSTIRASTAAAVNPFRYSETAPLSMATSFGHPEINDWWCDIGKEGCLRPTAHAVHGGNYEPGLFWYKENLCVCEACYRAGYAEDHHGYALAEDEMRRHRIPGELSPAGTFAPGWRKSDYHKFLGFAGNQSRGASRAQETTRLRHAKRAQDSAHKALGASLQRSAVEQRRQAGAAEEEIRLRNDSSAHGIKRAAHERASRAEQVRMYRLHHAAMSASEVRGLIDVMTSDADGASVDDLPAPEGARQQQRQQRQQQQRVDERVRRRQLGGSTGVEAARRAVHAEEEQEVEEKHQIL
jgi:uncharacterized membrane protein YgcG